MKTKFLLASALVISALALSACGQGKAVYPTRDRGESAPRMSNEPRHTVFGDEGLFSQLQNGKKDDGNGSGGIGVNSFLWRAALDTVAFMPLSSADPFGGTILTDWYQLPESPTERFKFNIFILDRALRADGVKASIFKQIRDPSGQWLDIHVDAKMASTLEDAILTRARQLRIVSTN